LESTPDGIIMVNATGRIVLANSQAEKLFGYQHGELQAKLVEVLLPQRFSAAHVGHRANFFAQAGTRPMGRGIELFGRRKDGTAFPVEISLSPLETDEGVMVMSAIRDISAHRRMEHDLKASEVRYRRLFETAKDGILILDARTGQITDVNPFLIEMLGHSHEEFVGKKLWDVGPFKDVPPAKQLS